MPNTTFTLHHKMPPENSSLLYLTIYNPCDEMEALGEEIGVMLPHYLMPDLVILIALHRLVGVITSPYGTSKVWCIDYLCGDPVSPSASAAKTGGRQHGIESTGHFTAALYRV